MVETAATTRRLLRAGNEQITAIVLTALLPPEVRGRRERFRETHVRSSRVVNLRSPTLLLVHYGGVLELLDERFLSSFD